MLKDAVIRAAELAGGPEGLVGYLQARAVDTPGPFLSLLGKVLPLQVVGEGGGPLIVQIIRMSDMEKDADDPTAS